MKKKILAMAAVLVLAVTLLAGCGRDTHDRPDEKTLENASHMGYEQPETLEGTVWKVTKVEWEDQHYTPNAESEEVTFTFKDGIATMAGGDQAKSAEYVYENGRLTIGGDICEVRGNTILVYLDNTIITIVRKESDVQQGAVSLPAFLLRKITAPRGLCDRRC